MCARAHVRSVLFPFWAETRRHIVAVITAAIVWHVSVFRSQTEVVSVETAVWSGLGMVLDLEWFWTWYV